MQNDRRIKKKIVSVVALFGVPALLFFCLPLSYRSLQETGISQSKKKILSELFGYTLWNDIKHYREYYNIEEVINGMRSCERGDLPPLDVQAKETIQLTSNLQRELYENSSNKNLKRAENFLNELVQKPSICMLEDKKLYDEVVCEGHDGAKITPEEMATFHYSITTLDNEEIINTWKENEPKRIRLADAIIGLSKGVVGMKEGEKRKIYIHPDLAYRKTGWLVPAQTLLIFEIQLVGKVIASDLDLIEEG